MKSTIMASLFDAPVKDIVVPSVRLRPYQQDCVDAVYRDWNQVPEVRSTLVCLPTGTGKSVVFAATLDRWLTEHSGRVLIIAHRKELIAQAKGHAHAVGASCAVEMAGQYATSKADVVVASVQTLTAGRVCDVCEGADSLDCHQCGGSGSIARMTRFDPHDFGLVITDEGHHGTAKSYRKVYEWFGQNERLRMLFVTATPKRADGDGLHNVCDAVAYERSLPDMIADGWLCPIRQQFIEVAGLDLSAVKTKAGGDLSDGDLEHAFLGDTDEEEERLLHAIAKPTLDIARGQQFIVFAAGREHAHKLTAAFNSYGNHAELILGNTDQTEREKIVERLKRGQTQGLVNVGVATEGFDCPAVAVVAVARPTKSESLYLQMIGRGTRPLPGVVDGPADAISRHRAIASSAKRVCTVLDFVGNSGRHKLVSVADVLAGEDVDPIDLQEAIRVARGKADAQDMEELIERVKQAREEREAREEEERQRLLTTRHRADRADYHATDVDLFGGNSFNAENNTPRNLATPKQRGYLKALGVMPDVVDKQTKGQAGALISAIKNGEPRTLRRLWDSEQGCWLVRRDSEAGRAIVKHLADF